MQTTIRVVLLAALLSATFMLAGQEVLSRQAIADCLGILQDL
jgi:hypothetical protein